MTADRAADTTGSEALTMCVKDTAPAPKLMTAPMCVPRWPQATGKSVLRLSCDSFGVLRAPVDQSSKHVGDAREEL